jgi:hypothetical protein
MPITDYTEAELQPRNLTADEIADPHQVISELFNYGHLPQIREMLWDLLKTATTGTYHKQSATERTNLVSFYEKLAKLIEAAWVIHKKG